MFVPSNTDLWDRLDALFLNELWIIGMRDDFLLRAVKYYMVRTFNLITGQNVSSRPHHFRAIHWNNQYQVFYLWPFIPNTVGTFLPERRVCLKLIWKNCKMHTASLMYCMWNWNISKIICIFKWYISLHFILKFSKYTFKCFLSEHLYTEDCSAAAHEPNMLTDAESWAPHTGAVATFPKSHIIECFFNIGRSFQAYRPCFQNQALANSWEWMKQKKKKKTSQVKFKDVFLLEARLRCHKPRETFSCSTFFMVSLRVSSLPFSLHLGSRVTYCCTGCGPQPAGGFWGGQFLPLGLNRSPPLPNLHQKSSPSCPWMALTVEDPSENPPPGQHYLSLPSPPLSNNTPPAYSELMANSNQL